jgi:hypothetical protein
MGSYHYLCGRQKFIATQFWAEKLQGCVKVCLASKRARDGAMRLPELRFRRA